MKTNMVNILIGAVAALVLLSMSMFVVDQRQAAIVLQLGEMVGVKTEPGLYFKMPLVQNVRYFDSRILTLDSGEPERFITAEKKNVMVDSFVKWRIVDVKQYYISVGGDEERAQDAFDADGQLEHARGIRQAHHPRSGVRRTRQDHGSVARKGRCRCAQDWRAGAGRAPEARGFPTEISESVYRRMDAERKRVANELRATGNAESEKIRADADRQREVILAECIPRCAENQG